MISRRLLAVALASGVLTVAGGALAAAKPKAPDATMQVAYNFPVYDRLVDPATMVLRSLLADAGTTGTFLDKRDSAGVAEYYAEQGYLPTWTVDGHLTAQAEKIIARLHQADADGLSNADFPTPVIGMGSVVPAGSGVAARAEIMLSTAIVRYAREAHSGRLDPADISPNFGYTPHLVDPVEVLASLAVAPDPAAALSAYNPTHVEFTRLRDKLAELRADVKPLPPVVPDGKLLKLGMRDPRVVVLRVRLDVTAMAEDPTLFDADVDLAVKAFQEQAKLKADGVLGKGTLGLINAGSDDHISTLLANMERWRWMPENLGKFYVRVNVPNFDLDIYQDDAVVFNTRIVDGQTDKQTPIFSDEIETAVVNPTWNVPASIALKEMLPKLMANPAALRSYQVFANMNGRFQIVDPMMVDWSSVDMRRIQIKQPPGDDNALGSIKFLFPNPYAVYLHDTPSKSFFQRDYRALSHGCMRVQNPWDFAAALLKHDPKVSVAQLKKLVGGRETAVNLTTKIPVHITYFTAWVDSDGTLQTRPDVYGHDQRMELALGV